MILANRFGYDEREIRDFERRWLELIETEEYLNKDTVYSGVAEALNRLKRKNVLYLATARQSVETTIAELKRLGLFDFFNDVFVTEHKTTKEELIRRHVASLSPDDVFVGDTGKDVQTGKALGMKTIAVSNGFLDPEILREYNPDNIIKDIRELEKNVG